MISQSGHVQLKDKYAHSINGVAKDKWQTLEDHLVNVANLAETMCSDFNTSGWGYVAGLYHDIGKINDKFQLKLNGASVKVDHSSLGAKIVKDFNALSILLSYVIAGHHGGIPDGGFQSSNLHYRLLKTDIVNIKLENIKLVTPFNKLDVSNCGFQLALFTRMIFSCLVDSDFLDTEYFYKPFLKKYRNNNMSINKLNILLDKYITKLSKSVKQSVVNSIRTYVLQECNNKAINGRGMFSLTVPTGGGKTLSSLSFALKHAIHNNMNRIIYAIPFTSIVEQTSEIFKNILGDDNVVEHHCNFNNDNYKNKLRSENWNAPLIVTTNVQLFETLFHYKPSKCRKLHNMTNSVIILDEAQTIPLKYLEPCLSALKELVLHYNCSIVFCTATQPAISNKYIKNSINDINEIITDVDHIFNNMDRVSVFNIGKILIDDLAIKILKYDTCLCIVNTKKEAQELFWKINKSGNNYHLSTNMCPIHRQQVIKRVKNHLKNHEPCRVISTNLIEAGVDIDFHVVFKGMCGLDSIIQAAGRCNREGKLNKGELFIYELNTMLFLPDVNRAISKTKEIFYNTDDYLNLNNINKYYNLLYNIQNLDEDGIMTMTPNQTSLTKDILIPFKEISNKFNIINEDVINVVIPFNDNAISSINKLKTDNNIKSIRELQLYTVSVYTTKFKSGYKAEDYEFVNDICILKNMDLYNMVSGINIQRRSK